MAFNKKMLQQFLDNPARVPASEFNEDEPIESPGIKEAPLLAPEEMLQSEDIEPEVSPEAPDSDEFEDEMGENQLVSAPQLQNSDPELLAKLRKLKAGEPLDELSEGETADVASDTEAPIELRKQAIQKIKQKYLGRQNG